MLSIRGGVSIRGLYDVWGCSLAGGGSSCRLLLTFMAESPSQLALSVVIPIYNEVENLPELVRRCLEVLRALDKPFELILIDDGSRDGSADLLAALAEQEPELKGILLRRNFGQSAAMTAGFQHAEGEVVVSLDGDLQNDPADIPELLARIEAGDDVVCGWRKERMDDFLLRKFPSRVANWLIGVTTGVKLHDYGCSLKAYRRELVENLILYGELHRFIPVLVSLQGARLSELAVRHHARTKGVSKYGIGRLPKVLIDLVLMLFFLKFATRPLQFFGRAGGLLFLGGLGVSLYLSGLKLFLGQDIGNRPLLLLGVLLILTGVLLFCIGLLAELVVRTYYEASGRRIYSVRRIVGASEEG